MSAQLRLWGDPFRQTASSRRLRSLLTEARRSGWRCALCLTGAAGEKAGMGRPLPLNDGVRDFAVHTLLSDAELAPMVEAGAACVAATAPLVVFGTEDELVTAALEFPRACLVWSGIAAAPDKLLESLAGVLDSVGLERPRTAVDVGDLEPFLQLAPPDPDAPILHPCTDVHRDGTDVLLEAWRRIPDARAPLVMLLPRRDAAVERELLERAGDAGSQGRVTFAAGPMDAEHLRGAGAVVWPLRLLDDPPRLIRIMASGRPLVVSRNRYTASILSAPGLCAAIGGRHVPRHEGMIFEPDVATLTDSLRVVAGDRGRSTVMACRARAHVMTHHSSPRPPGPAVARRRSRPLVVLEAPLFETSSSACLTIETARAVQRRGRVELRLVPRLPFRSDVGHLRRNAPSLVPFLSRDPGRADLWLCSGWPPRADRPDTRCFGLRLDWEYGSLPAELSPLVPQEADLIVVHSRAVQRVVAASGRAESGIVVIPHGVDSRVFHHNVAPSPEVMKFKKGRPALLFVGGLIWRKGIDLFLKAALELGGTLDLCAVVKPVGTRDSYHGQSMAALVQRFSATPGAPDLLVLDEEMEPSGLAALYRSCDLMLHPYRGEGFGMPVLEAQACGLPVLVSSGGSTDDFCDPRGSVAVPTRRHFPNLKGVFRSPPHVLEPVYSELLSRLRQVMSRLPELQRSARAASDELRARYTWDRAAEALETIAFGIAARCADRIVVQT